VAKGKYAQCLLHQTDVRNLAAVPHTTPLANAAPIPTKNTTSIELVGMTESHNRKVVRGIGTRGERQGLARAQNRTIDRGPSMPKAMPQEAPNGRKCKRVLLSRDVTGGSAAREKGFAIPKGNQLGRRSRVEKVSRSTTRIVHAVSLARRQHGYRRTESIK